MLSVLASLVEFFLVIGVALAAILLKTLDARGFLASVAVGLAIMYGGGFNWFVIVAVFFVLGVVFTLYKYGFKREIGGAQDKGGARNWPNILANGGVASAVAVANFLHPSGLMAAAFLGAVSTSAADTAATELGLLSKSKPKLITHPSRAVTPGTSGGVSFLGLLAAVLASLVIGTMALLLGLLAVGIAVLTLCVASGVAGALFDSFLGATVQRQGYCVVCMKPTEAIKHCGEHTMVTDGVWLIENNMVNLFATVVGGVVSALVFVYFIQTA